LEVRAAEYAGHRIRFIEGPETQLLLNTEDVCGVLGRVERPEGSDLAESGLDLTSAVTVALQYGDEEFAMWLNERFGRYDLETLVRPRLTAEDWNAQ
jgi:hypothetical protein